MKKLAITSVALAAFGAGVASAADMPVKAPPKPVAVATWTGCYGGGNVGWIGGADHYDLSMAGGFLNPINIFSDPANSAPLNHSYDPHNSGVTGGVQVGCNYQTGAVVIGAEADFNGSGLRDSINAAYGVVTLPGGGTVNPHTESVTGDLDWFSTFRARLGFTPAPQWLLYVTGGAAVGHIRSSAGINFGTVAGVGLLPGFPFNGSDTTTRTGWTAGAGAEYALGNNWSLKAEYLYLDFGSFNYLATCTPTPAMCTPAAGQALFAWNIHTRMHDNVARVGLNYRFH